MPSTQKNSTSAVFLTLCTMGLFAILSSTMSKSPVLNPFSASLETPTDWTGFVASASTIPGILISLPAASLSDVMGRKRFLLIAAFVFASAPFLYLLITVWWQLILVRFYHGFATAIFMPVAEASIAELFPSNRGERISLFSSATYIGRLVAPSLGGYILFVTAYDFHVLYLAVAVAGVTALIMALPFLARREQHVAKENLNAKVTTKQIFQGWKRVAQSSGVSIVSFVQACQYYVYGATEFFLVGYLTEIAPNYILPAGIVSMVIIGVAIFARPYMGRVADRTGRRIPIVAGCLVSGLPLLAIPFVTDLWIILLLLVVYGFGFATVIASTPALISELAPKELVGTSMGFLDTVMDVGQTLGPIVSGFILATSFRYRGVFPSLTFVLLLSCIAFVASNTGKAKSDNQT